MRQVEVGEIRTRDKCRPPDDGRVSAAHRQVSFVNGGGGRIAGSVALPARARAESHRIVARGSVVIMVMQCFRTAGISRQLSAFICTILLPQNVQPELRSRTCLS